MVSPLAGSPGELTFGGFGPLGPGGFSRPLEQGGGQGLFGDGVHESTFHQPTHSPRSLTLTGCT